MTKEEPYYVLLTYSVWPSIYTSPPKIRFPNKKAAKTFAKHNICVAIPKAEVFTMRNELIAGYQLYFAE